MNRRGIFTLEYSLLIAIVVAAFLAMSIYLKRAVCGKWRESADTIGAGQQYDRTTSIEIP